MALLQDLTGQQGLQPDLMGALREQPPPLPPPQMQSAAPPEDPKAKARGHIQEFMSDLMFSLAESFGAGPQRGAGLAAALAGPSKRRTLIAQAEDERRKLEADLAAKEAALQKSRVETEEAVAEGKRKQYQFDNPPLKWITVTDAAGVERRVVDTGQETVTKEAQAPAPVKVRRTLGNGEQYDEWIAGGQNLIGMTEAVDNSQDRRQEDQQAFTAAENIKTRAAAAARTQQAADARIKAVEAAGLNGELNPKQMTTAIQLAGSLKAHPAYTDMLDIATGINGVESGLSQKSGLGDITAINSFQRMVDPGATVRSEDVALIRSASAILDRVFSEYPIEKLMEGAVLPEATREQLRKTAVDLYERRAKNYNDMVGTQYKGLAKAGGIPFELVGADFVSRNAPAAQNASTAPAGVDQSVWDVMTPEERALWQN